ncbi:U3 small nucleolar RNA-associated protein 4 homolog [Diorhabda carinulata]|uniref:U3 small nucleolar RNA-associated protein 4 homolog n=1 Tax=Diorhabda carinulata TaxID=1163345 RepID=UPI0025A11D7D|nr:U3 small nucleolar RNA-associated protein 4 homolog [Diorhabda carinulata]
MTHCKVHNVRFYNPEPQPIRCMKIHYNTKKLALSRSDASVEIWNLQNTWFLEKSIVPSTENFSIEDLAWCDNRLLSVGLHGLLVEYNLSKLSLENRWAVTGEAAFCLDVNKTNTKIAIGTEQGYLNIFTVKEDGIYFKKFLDKQEGRIISLKFDSTGEFIASGSIDAIRVWNVETGHAIHKMTTGRSEANKPTIVWCINITDDFTIISGDSRGKLTFWDGKIGAQIESYQSHKADILTICLSSNQSSLYCAGVDPNIINYEKITIKSGAPKWVRSIQRKIHEHDVNALVLLENKLYSGGADSYLACSFHPPKTLLKLPPILQNPCVQLAPAAKRLLLRYPKHIELWNLGKSKDVDVNYRGLLSLNNEPKKLLELKRVMKNYENEEDSEGIICTAISKDGTWILYSTIQGVNLFQFIYNEENPILLKVDNLEHKNIPCLCAAFTSNNKQLITCPNSGNLLVYQLLENKASLLQTIETFNSFECITFLNISTCSNYLVVGDTKSNILTWKWNGKKNEWLKYCKLPRYKSPPMVMALHPKTTNLVVVYSDSKLIEYDLKKKEYTNFSNEFEKSDWKSRPYPIRNITFDPRNKNNIILQDDSNIIVINKNLSTNKKNKIARTNSEENSLEKSSEGFEISLVKKYKHLAHLEWMEEDELVAVEVSPLTIMEQLPPAFFQNTFGKK